MMVGIGVMSEMRYVVDDDRLLIAALLEATVTVYRRASVISETQYCLNCRIDSMLSEGAIQKISDTTRKVQI